MKATRHDDNTEVLRAHRDRAASISCHISPLLISSGTGGAATIAVVPTKIMRPSQTRNAFRRNDIAVLQSTTLDASTAPHLHHKEGDRSMRIDDRSSPIGEHVRAIGSPIAFCLC